VNRAMKKRGYLLASLMGRLFLLPLMLVLSLIILSAELAAQGRVVAQAPVDIRIQSKFSLRLRIGSPGGRIDVVRFSVSGLPGSGQVQGISSGPNPVPVKAKARFSSGQMILTADSSIPLEDGAGNTIPFSEIGWGGTGGMPSGTFSNAADQVIMATSSSDFNGAMSFYYKNILYIPSGVYTSRVTYTLSSP
jgi:hypothetical protein